MSAEGGWLIGERIAAGSARMLRGVPGLLWVPGEWRETTARWTILGGSGSVAAAGVVLHPWLGAVAGACWCTAAVVISRPAEPEDAEADDEDEDGKEDEQLLPADDFAALVHEVAAGRNVHLTAIGQRLLDETQRAWDVLALCRAHGITTKPVRVAGADPAVTTGIHRLDLPPLPRPLSGAPVGVVVAGQPDNNNTDRPTAEEVSEGVVIITRGPSIRQEARR